jgi:NAD(P)H-dependent FMN reductase
MTQAKILIISGTNRPGSNALKISKILQGHYAAASVPSEILSLEELPPQAFEPSTYASKPESVQKLQKRVLDAAGLHVVTPEYNGSFPGVLKYFIDLLKFPESFERKPVAFVGEAAGLWGGLRSVEQLQQIFGYRNAHIYPDRVFIPQVHEKLEGSRLKDSEIEKRLLAQTAGFASFIRSLSR